MPEAAKAAADQPQPQQQDQQDPPPPPAKKVYDQDEVDRIAAKVRRNARREAEQRLQRELQARQPAPQREEPKGDPDPEPKRDDFEDYESYSKALAEHAGRRGTRTELEKAEREKKEKAQAEEQEKAARTWQGKIEKALDKHDDFEDVLEDNGAALEVIYKAPMRAAIIESDIGPLIVYELCKNPAELERIKALPGYKQAAEIVKIEDKLLAAGKPADDKGDKEVGGKDDAEDPEERKAREDRERDAAGRFRKDPPAPIEPGSGRPATNSSLPSDKDDPETWRRKEVARMERRKQGKN